MTAPLVKPTVLSIYEVKGHRVLMPERMARATPDLKQALHEIQEALRGAGGDLVLSDLFRSYDMQLQAHLDFTSGKKSAFSPAPGSSMHESGRAFDIDLSSMKVALPTFWEIARRARVVPIIAKPDPKLSESWHFECRGSHQLVYDYYKAGKGTNFATPSQAMAASAIIAVGVRHDKYKDNQKAAYVQSALIRLGYDIGNMDGEIGPKTRAKLGELAGQSVDELAVSTDLLLQEKFPEEFFDKTPDIDSPFA